jgi:hypothetical protein
LDTAAAVGGMPLALADPTMAHQKKSEASLSHRDPGGVKKWDTKEDPDVDHQPVERNGTVDRHFLSFIANSFVHYLK